jgi:hypothetical protein
MNDSPFDRGRACFLTIRRRLKGMPVRKKTFGYIRVSFALILTVIAVLWSFNHYVTKQRTQDQYDDKLAHLPPLRKM